MLHISLLVMQTDSVVPIIPHCFHFFDIFLAAQEYSFQYKEMLQSHFENMTA